MEKYRMQPDVSVVIAAKDEELYVQEAVLSILRQTGLAYELVFVDDNSTDRTFEIVSEIAKNNPTIRLTRNPGKGKVSAYNYGMEQAQGVWACEFAGDDVMPDGSLAARWQAVKDVGGDKPVVGLCRLITWSEIKSQDGHVVPRNPNRGALSGVSYMMDRRARGKLYPIPGDLVNDDTWLELGVTYFDFTVVHSAVIGCKWRVHSANSINLLVPYAEFNSKYTPRMAAAALFDKLHGQEILDEARSRLVARVRSEEARKRGDIVGILRSGTGSIQKVRDIALCNATFYEIRKRLYGLLTGW